MRKLEIEFDKESGFLYELMWTSADGPIDHYTYSNPIHASNLIDEFFTLCEAEIRKKDKTRNQKLESSPISYKIMIITSQESGVRCDTYGVCHNLPHAIAIARDLRDSTAVESEAKEFKIFKMPANELIFSC